MTASRPGPLATARTRLSRGVEASRFVGVARTAGSTMGRWIRGSRIAGWFLVAPEPRVVRIDPRETALLGPPLRLARGAGERLGRRPAGSRLHGVASSTADRVAAAPLRWLGVALAAGSLVAVLVRAAVGDAAGGPLLVLGVGLLLTRERRSISALSAARFGRALQGALAPPDEPRNGDR